MESVSDVIVLGKIGMTGGQLAHLYSLSDVFVLLKNGRLGKQFAHLDTSSEVFGLWQIAIHHPSEHFFEGRQVPVEVQLYKNG